jgi:hypothetical protein
MHDVALALATLPAPTRIFGLPMRPYSLGHELQLIRESNSLLSGGSANVPRIEFAQAVLICSQTFEECRRINFDWLAGIKIAAWRWRMRNVDHDPHVQAFINYRRDGSRFLPQGRQTIAGSGSVKVAGAPFLLRLYQFLRIKFNEPNPWDYPLGLATMQFAAYWEEKGSYSIYSEVDQVQDEALAALDEEEARAKESGN